MRLLYRDMKAAVAVDPENFSREVAIERGVRQGDPLSPLLFNLVMNKVLAEVTPVWKRRGYGTKVGETGEGLRLTHVMFADDITLIARSWTSIKRMLQTLRVALARRGLALHPGKCKMQSNIPNQEAAKATIEEDFVIDIVPARTGFKLLGTMVHLDDATGQEIQNRISAARRMFWGMKAIFLNREISVNRRLKLFDATVSSCFLWCCESWTPRSEDLRSIRVARNAMLRRIVGCAFAPDEEYVDWIRRATRKATKVAKAAGVRDWLKAHFKSAWQWAGHVARREPQSWLHKVVTWRDSHWQELMETLGIDRPLRPSTRRWMKWEDRVRRYCKDCDLVPWTILAKDGEQWHSHTARFAEHS